MAQVQEKLVPRLAKLLSDLGTVSLGKADLSAKLVGVLLEHRSGTPGELGRWAGVKGSGTVSTCLSDLYEDGLIVREVLGEERARNIQKESKMEKTPRVVYAAPSDFAERLERWADTRVKDRKSRSERALMDVLDFLRRPNPVIMIETIVSSRASGEKLQPSDYAEAVNQTIRLYREAKKSIRILTRDFDWVSDPMPTIRTALSERESLKVDLLLAWEQLDLKAKNELRGDIKRWKRRLEIRDLASPEIFRMSMVDDERAIVVKKSVEPIAVKFEGVFIVDDSEFTSIVLREFFESRWKISPRVRP